MDALAKIVHSEGSVADIAINPKDWGSVVLRERLSSNRRTKCEGSSNRFLPVVQEWAQLA